nr:Chain B, Peptide from Polymerase cofactor VP35 [Ebola virus]
KTRNSQTQTD